MGGQHESEKQNIIKRASESEVESEGEEFVDSTEGKEGREEVNKIE